MATHRGCFLFQIIRPYLSDLAGFPLDFMEHDNEICFSSITSPGQITTHLVAGVHRTVLMFDTHTIGNERATYDAIERLIAAGIEDIQGQYHHANDYQFAVQKMAAEAVNV